MLSRNRRIYLPKKRPVKIFAGRWRLSGINACNERLGGYWHYQKSTLLL